MCKSQKTATDKTSEYRTLFFLNHILNILAMRNLSESDRNRSNRQQFHSSDSKTYKLFVAWRAAPTPQLRNTRLDSCYSYCTLCIIVLMHLEHDVQKSPSSNVLWVQGLSGPQFLSSKVPQFKSSLGPGPEWPSVPTFRYAGGAGKSSQRGFQKC